MRKTALVMAMVLLMTCILAIPAQAVEPRTSVAIPGLNISGTTATCTLRATADSFDDHLEATIRLYRGSTKIATWYAEGDGYLFFSETKTITSGYTYTLKVDLTVNGVDFPVPDVSK